MKRLLLKLKTLFRLLFGKIKEILGLDITNKGERIFIKYGTFNYENMDIYQKAHYQRYLFAKQYINNEDIVGDMACGTGYGSLMLGEKAKRVIAVDINKKIIDKISKKYNDFLNVKFLNQNLVFLHVNEGSLDKIVSFETLEHLDSKEIIKVLANFNHVLRTGGYLIFSTPFMQKSEDAVPMGFHKIFNINEDVLRKWFSEAGFKIRDFFYQNYHDFTIEKEKDIKDFIIGAAEKVVDR